MSAPIYQIDGANLSTEQLSAIAHGAGVTLAAGVRERMSASAQWLSDHTGPDPFDQKWHWLAGHEAPATASEGVRAFLRSHCAGVGPPLSRIEIRALMTARINTLAAGYSAIRPQVIDRYLYLLNHDYLPTVPSQGSLGAAGCPQLSHIAWAAFGFGGTLDDASGNPVDLRELADLAPIALTPKEALALVNGPALAIARGVLAVERAKTLLRTAESAASLSFECVQADLNCLNDAALRTRHHPGAVQVAATMRAHLEGSTLCHTGRAPDPFSIRCTPAVLGAAQDALDYIATTMHRELNGATANPLILPSAGLFETGNLHGAPTAMALDHLKVALAQVASISERRAFRMTYGQLSGLPSFLVRSSGINSGLMLAQYTAASLVSECKSLAFPASVDSLPTAQHREDHVSMASIAAETCLRITEAVADVLAIELMCAAQGCDLRMSGDFNDHGTLGTGTQQTLARVRAVVPKWTEDRVLHPDLAALGKAVRDGQFV